MSEDKEIEENISRDNFGAYRERMINFWQTATWENMKSVTEQQKTIINKYNHALSKISKLEKVREEVEGFRCYLDEYKIPGGRLESLDKALKESEEKE